MPRASTHHLHWHWPQYEFDHSHNMRWLFAMRFLRDVVNHLTTFFVPIYIYQQMAEGRLLPMIPGTALQRGMIGIALFFITYRVVTLFCVIPLARIATRAGLNTLLLASHFFYALYLAALVGSRWQPWLILVAGLIDGLQVAAFWPSYQTLMSRGSLKKHMGEDLGVIQFLLRLSALISPAIGGYVIVTFGFSTVFLLGLLGICLSAFAVLMMKHVPEPDVVSFAELRTWLKESAFDSLAITYFGRYINDAVVVLWPVYIFLFIGSVESVGFLYTLSLFVAMVLSFAAGYYVDHGRSKRPFFISGAVLSALWIIRMQIWSFWHIVTINILDKLAADFHWLFYDTAFMKRGKGGQAFSYFVYREVIQSVSALVFWTAVIGLFTVFMNGWASLFVLASVGVLLTVLINEEYHQ